MEGIKRIKREIFICTFIITFEYETKKGYRREQQRTIKGFEGENIKFLFKEWSKNQRTMFNVEILSIVKTTEKERIEI